MATRSLFTSKCTCPQTGIASSISGSNREDNRVVKDLLDHEKRCHGRRSNCGADFSISVPLFRLVHAIVSESMSPRLHLRNFLPVFGKLRPTRDLLGHRAYSCPRAC